MPNLIGQNLTEATASLMTAGIIEDPSWYQFEHWPISVQRSKNAPGVVSAQSPAAGTSVSFNVPITLTVGEPALATVYP